RASLAAWGECAAPRRAGALVGPGHRPNPGCLRGGGEVRPAVVFGQLHAGLALTRALGRDGVPVHGVALDEREFGLRSRYLLSRTLASSDEHVLELLRGLPERPVLFAERDENVA